MTENKRFKLSKDSQWWLVKDNTIKVNEFGFRDDLTEEDMYRGLRKELTEKETVELLNKLYEENKQLKQSINIMGGRLQGLWAHYNANRWGIWAEAAEDIANELGFRIYHPRDIPIPDSKSKKERVEGVKKITEILGEKELIKEENKQLKKELDEFKKFVFSDEGILCYSCAKCLLKGIYEVECSEKGTVDVHSTCCLYKKNEVK